MKHFSTITELHRVNQYPRPANPLISLIRCDKTTSCSIAASEFTSDFYMISFKKMKSGIYKYGRTKYDHDCGSLSFASPRQVVEIRDVDLEENGFVIYFHEDLLAGHPLRQAISNFSYFDYDTNEALHLSPKEEEIVWEIFNKIELEYHNNPDEYSREIMLTHLDSILKYSQRFYKRQFINRFELSGKTVTRFNEVLKQYYSGQGYLDKGLPSVKFIASSLNMSTRYLSDLLKQETGKTAIELIHIFLISEAKHLMRGSDRNITEIAYALGFDNMPYFSRLFKREIGLSPQQYRKQLLN
ncbi:helix-turn-helix domain-containing protein [Spirosoma pomorum]